MQSLVQTVAVRGLSKAVAAALVLAACGGGGGTGNSGTATTSTSGGGACIPGAQLACACPGGGQGVQLCRPDGSGLEACSCTTGTGTGGSSPCTSTIADPDNCGACGHSCQGGACVASKCQPVMLATVGLPYSVTVDATSAYWPDAAGGGSVLKVPIGGGPAVRLATGQGDVRHLAVDAKSVYWVAIMDGVGQQGTLRSMPVAGGPTTDIGTATYADAIAVDATSVYVATDADGAVYKLPIVGGAGTVLLSTTFTMFGGGYGMALDGTNLCCAVSGALMKVPVSGSPATAVFVGTPSPFAVAADATGVYWTDGAQVMKTPSGGGASTSLAVQPGPSRVAVDGTNVYWLDLNTTPCNLMKVPVGGGVAEIVAACGKTTADIAVDGTSVYWASEEGIMKIAK